jgi:hypothetical protein
LDGDMMTYFSSADGTVSSAGFRMHLAQTAAQAARVCMYMYMYVYVHVYTCIYM